RSWKAQTAMTHDGTDAAEGGPLQAGVVGEVNRISTQVEGPGALSFWWRLEDARCFQFSFLVGSAQRARLGPSGFGSTDWQQQTVSIPAGTQDLRWVFTTMCGDGSSPGRAWLDEVTYRRDGALTLAIGIPDENTVTIQVSGLPGTRFNLQVSTDLRSWESAGVPETTLPDTGLTLFLAT